MPGLRYARAMNSYASASMRGSGRGGPHQRMRREDLRGALLGTGSKNWDEDATSCDGSGDRDLQAMVHDFIENEACGGCMDGSDGDGGSADRSTLSERLQVCVKAQSAHECELLGEVQRLLLSANDVSDLICSEDCRGACIKRFVVKRLKLAAYSAAVCRSAWSPAPGRVPGGEYEYIEVVARGTAPLPERLIVDVSFQAQFEIARPTAQYAAALQSVPTVFVGAAPKLEQVLRIMSDAARASLEQSDMHLPPWRTLQYVRCKWLSNFTTTSAAAPLPWRPSCQCGRDELRRTKVSLLAETTPARERSSRVNLQSTA